jgi:hypothetical protein
MEWNRVQELLPRLANLIVTVQNKHKTNLNWLEACLLNTAANVT